jgi:hypothetical protein
MPETLQTLELAAADRLHEAAALLKAGRPGGAIYVSGLAAEMALKVVVFRLEGHRPDSVIHASLSPLNRVWVRQHLPALYNQHESFHSLYFWGQVVLAMRRYHGRVPQRSLALRTGACVGRLYQTWWIQMRYRPDQALLSEARQSYDDARWFYDHRAALWS